MHRDIAAGPGARDSDRAGRSIVAVIGINQYVAWPRLENAVNDAASASRLFQRLGFDEVTPPLLDGAATGDALRRLVTEDLAQLSSDDSLVLFFAGHGHTHTAQFGDISVKTGCVIPIDGAPPRGRVSASWLRLDTWLSDLARLPPRHILVIVDACHSGISLGAVHKWRAEGPGATPELAALHARRSRRIITSALDDQLALDSGPYPGHSLFTGCLIEALSGGLARAGQRVTTGRELGHYLQKRVRSYPPSLQTPDFGPFELDDRGDIVVPLLHEEPADGPARFEEDAAIVPNLVNVSRQIATGSRWSRLDLWLTSALITGALAMWTARGVDGDRLPGAMPGNAAAASVGATEGMAPTAPDDAGARAWPERPSGNGLATLIAPSVRDPADPDAMFAARIALPETPTATTPATAAAPAGSHEPLRSPTPSSPGGSPARPTAPPASHAVRPPAPPTPAVSPPPAPKTSSPPAANHAPSDAAYPATPVLDTDGASGSGLYRCSRADFAAIYEAAMPSSAEVREALGNLRVCHEAGAISDADFERYQAALVARL